jgi:hypothetical protein
MFRFLFDHRYDKYRGHGRFPSGYFFFFAASGNAPKAICDLAMLGLSCGRAEKTQWLRVLSRNYA